MKRWLVRGLAAIGALWLVVTCTPVLRWWIAPLSRPWDNAKGETLIVLGSEVNFDGTIGYHSYLRALQAVRVFRAQGFQDVMVSGGHGIAEGIREYLIGSGIPADRIAIEGQSMSTRENAMFTARMLAGKPGRKVLLTSDIHTFRAWRAFRKAGLDVRTSTAPDAGKLVYSPLARWGVFLDLCVESTKIVWYWARGWI